MSIILAEMPELDVHRPLEKNRTQFDLFSSLLILWHRRYGFLMQLRSADARVMPSSIGFFGGGIHDGEAPYLAAQREMSEELGFSAPLDFHSQRVAPVEPDHIELAFFFSAELDRDRYSVNEGSGSVWVNPLMPPDRLHSRDLMTLLSFKCSR
jgi:8-oxo-dGTP pyrophosphatase MutT (NUDIX family)